MATQNAIQTAIYLALDGAAGLTALLAAHAYTAGKRAIYDGVPQPDDAGALPPFPFVAIGEWTVVPWDTDSDDGRESTVVIHTLSRYEGKKELHNVMDAVKAALHDASLSITGEWCVLCYLEYAEDYLEPDGETRHGVQRFRIISEGN